MTSSDLRLTNRFARLSTGIKMLLILGLGLFPLGLIAILASIETARDNNVERLAATRARVVLKAQRIDTAIGRTVLTVRAANAAVAETAPAAHVCEATLRRLARVQELRGRFALYGGGRRPRCATAGYAPAPPSTATGALSAVEVTPDGRSLRIAVFDERGQPEALAEFSQEVLASLADLPGAPLPHDLILERGDRSMLLHDDLPDDAGSKRLIASAPALGGRILLRIRAAPRPISAAEIMMILLPVAMWVAAAVIGWLIVNGLLLKPLNRMQRAISAYQPGDRDWHMPALSSPAQEIGALGRAFDQVTRTVARHEAELEAAIERQTKLVREVHHRVKNNLQVVASLLNLHSRGAKNDDVAAAYASIQRRVDALAVVHRNHYAELEENRGVALRPLISELGANLRASAPASAAAMQLRIDIEPFYVTQDVAVSVAFLITEVVEFAMFCGASNIGISLIERGPGTARLALESDSLRGPIECDAKLFERFDRIVTGLSRQLRSAIERDLETGRYALDIMVVDKVRN